MDKFKLKISSAPHIRSGETSGGIMLDVIIALLPAVLMGTYYFGLRVLLIIAISVIAACLSEYLFCRIVRRKMPLGDMSAALTGLLLALTLPVSVPLWLPVIGSAFAIIIVKQLFGGIGQNFLNPALASRAFLLVAYPVLMTNWDIGHSGRVFDAFTGATPLSAMREGLNFTWAHFWQAMNGNILGSMGETATWALLLGLAYLLARRIVSWRIPIAYILSFALLTWLMGGNALFELSVGAVIFGAVFMATDYSTSPITKSGQIVFGIGCGVLNAVFRFFGAMPEGTTFAILLMNILSPLIDKLIIHRRYRQKI